MRKQPHSVRRFIIVAILAALLFRLVLIGSAPTVVNAAAFGCRVDPIVFLSNGLQAQITASISTDVSNVNSIAYTLHVPPGVTITEVRYNGADLASLESVSLVDDAPANTVGAHVLVKVQGGPVPTSARLSVGNGMDSAEGITGKDLILTVNYNSHITSSPLY